MSTARQAAAVAALVLIAVIVHAAPSAAADERRLDRAFIIVMENQGFDNVIGRDDGSGNPDTPFITQLAQRFGLATLSFGVTHPSLPNYLAMVGGDFFGVQDDAPSCFAQPAPVGPCHKIDGANLVDELEAANISWESYNQTMPSAGYLGVQFPVKPGPALYAQKHNPFVYFTDIATRPDRLAKLKPLNAVSDLAAALANPATAPRFVFVVPDQCRDMHGLAICPSGDALLKTGDQYVQSLVQTILASPSFTRHSALFVTWDENDFSSHIGCCDSPPIGGGHIATIVVTPKQARPVRSALEVNHYSLLRTLERAWDLPTLRNASDPKVHTLFGLFGDFED